MQNLHLALKLQALGKLISYRHIAHVTQKVEKLRFLRGKTSFTGSLLQAPFPSGPKKSETKSSFQIDPLASDLDPVEWGPATNTSLKTVRLPPKVSATTPNKSQSETELTEQATPLFSTG